jgi:O-antigen/teichoic acid export membrane protein
MFSKLKNHQGFKKYFKNTSWLFGEKILRMVVGLFVGIWVARYLGPEQFGLFSYAQSFVGLFVAIAGLGLDSIIVRELVKDESKRDALLGTAFRLKLIGTFFVLIALAIAVNLSQQDSLTTLLIFTIASATIFQSFNIIDFFFQAKVLSKYVVYANIISLFISSTVKVGLILNDAPLLYFAYSILFDSFILTCGFLYFYRYKRYFISQWFFDKNMARSLLKDSWPLILSGLVISIYMKIDQIMIKEMLNTEAVGQYAAAVRISEAWYFVPVIIASSFLPAIINSQKINKDIYYDRLQKLYKLMIWVSIFIAITMTFLSDWAVDFLYGEQYHQSGRVLMIHIWAGIFVSVGMITSQIVIVNNMQRNGLKATAAGSLFNVLLNYILIPVYGIQGAAIATIAAQIISGIIAPIYFKIDKKFPSILFKSILIKGK